MTKPENENEPVLDTESSEQTQADDTLPADGETAYAPVEVPEEETPTKPIVPVEPEFVLDMDTVPSQVAVINTKGVFIGMEDYPAGDPEEHQLVDITECDLEPGKYVWDGEAFQPIKSRNNAIALAVDAIDASIKVLQKQDQDIPLEVLIWIKSLKDKHA